MPAAYFLSTHHRPDLIIGLVEALGDNPVGIHVDARSSIMPVLEPLRGRGNVDFSPRHPCRWGDYGIVKASLEGLRWFLHTDREHLFLLSGQCFPLYDLAIVDEVLAGMPGRSLIDMEPFPLQRWMKDEAGGYRRYEDFFFYFYRKIRHIKPWKRKLPAGLRPYGGSAFMCLSRPHAQAILDRIARNPEIERFFSLTLIPDEIMFQTLLCDADLSTITCLPTHYTDWSEGNWNPAIIDEARAEAALASGRIFARKFNSLSVQALVDARRRSRPDAIATLRAVIDEAGVVKAVA